MHLVAVPVDYSENTRVLVDELRKKMEGEIGSARPRVNFNTLSAILPVARIAFGGVAARDSNRHCEVSLRKRTVPNLVAAFSLANQRASRCAHKFAQRAIKLRRHLGGSWLSFAKRGDL